MDDKTKSALDDLESLREVALFGEAEQQDEAQKAYEELRARLFCNAEDEALDDTSKEKA